MFSDEGRHQQLLDRLIGLASEVGYDVDLCADTGGADGSCNHRTELIQIAGRLTVNGKLAVLVHELAHALVAVELGDRLADTFDYASEELVVESIAFCCCQTVGLDTGANSIPYLTSWAEQAPVEVLDQAAQLTGRIADRIENTLLADTDENADAAAGGEPELVAAA